MKMETRLGRVVKVASPSHGLAWMQDAKDPKDGWFLDCKRKGEIAETENGPKLVVGNGNYSRLPAPHGLVYALVDSENSMALAWIPQSEFDQALAEFQTHQRAE